MVELFLDIETAPIFEETEYFETKKKIDKGILDAKSQEKDLYWRYERGGLNPYDGKVVLITFQINDAHIFRLKEWELGERRLLEKFYYLLRDLHQGSTPEDRLKIIGHNILRFDLFFLYERMRYYKIDEEKWLHQIVINKPEVIDFLQMHLPLNEFQTNGLKHDVIMHAYDFPRKSTLGSEEISHYYEKQYDKILEYSIREFVYPQLYKKIKKAGLVSGSILKEAIKQYKDSKIPSNAVMTGQNDS